MVTLTSKQTLEQEEFPEMNKEFLMTKGSTYEKDINILNLYAAHNMTSKCKRQSLEQAEIKNFLHFSQ